MHDDDDHQVDNGENDDYCKDNDGDNSCNDNHDDKHPGKWDGPLHNVHFVKYDVTVSFYDAVSDTIRRRGGDRGIFTEEGVDTVAYFRGNHGFRV